MLRKLLLALFLTLCSVAGANATAKFWNPYIVSGAVSGTGGVCRLTISPAIVGGGLLAGDNISVTGITGATGCNVDATISTVVDTTHIEITGTTFGGVYAAGGCVGGGHWTATNTANWVNTTTTATCGSGGGAVPGSSDAVTIDANSLSGEIYVNSTPSVQSLTLSAFTGAVGKAVLDFATTPGVGINLSASTAWVDAVSGTHTVNMGSGTWTFTATGGGTQISIGSSANLTLNGNTSTILYSATATTTRSVSIAGTRTLYNLTITNAAMNSFYIDLTGSANTTFNNVTFTNVQGIRLSAATALIINGTLTWDGTSAKQGILFSSNTASTLTLANNATLSWLIIQNINEAAGGGSLTCNSCFDGGGNTNVTINAPTSSGGFIIGGG